MILEIVSPEASLFKGEITSITLPGVDGSFQILNNHAPIVSLLQKGTVKITAPSFKFNKETAALFTKVNDQK
jgi:F-type H+-transporting ATPase subunit epsilon